jgi:hypothetical protein
MNDTVTTSNFPVPDRRARTVIIEALTVRMGVDLATDLASDVMVALRFDGFKVVRKDRHRRDAR